MKINAKGHHHVHIESPYASLVGLFVLYDMHTNSYGNNIYAARQPGIASRTSASLTSCAPANKGCVRALDVDVMMTFRIYFHF